MDEIEDFNYNDISRFYRYSYLDYLEFGKYQGKKISLIMGIDPEYLEWCILENDEFLLDEYAEEPLQYAHNYSLSNKAIKILKLKQKADKTINVAKR